MNSVSMDIYDYNKKMEWKPVDFKVDTSKIAVDLSSVIHQITQKYIEEMNFKMDLVYSFFTNEYQKIITDKCKEYLECTKPEKIFVSSIISTEKVPNVSMGNLQVLFDNIKTYLLESDHLVSEIQKTLCVIHPDKDQLFSASIAMASLKDYTIITDDPCVLILNIPKIYKYVNGKWLYKDRISLLDFIHYKGKDNVILIKSLLCLTNKSDDRFASNYITREDKYRKKVQEMSKKISSGKVLYHLGIIMEEEYRQKKYF